jgi:hypothetical protein
MVVGCGAPWAQAGPQNTSEQHPDQRRQLNFKTAPVRKSNNVETCRTEKRDGYGWLSLLQLRSAIRLGDLETDNDSRTCRATISCQDHARSPSECLTGAKRKNPPKDSALGQSLAATVAPAPTS